MEAVSRTQNKQGKLWKSIKEHKTLYLLMLPGLLYFVLFRYLPMFGLVIAFKNYNIFKGIWASDWVGLENFKELVHSADFWNVFKNTLVISLTKIVIGFPIPVLLAILLNEIKNIKFKRVTQTFIYLPHFLSWVVIGGIMLNLFSPVFGLAGPVLQDLWNGTGQHHGKEEHDFLGGYSVRYLERGRMEYHCLFSSIDAGGYQLI